MQFIPLFVPTALLIIVLYCSQQYMSHIYNYRFTIFLPSERCIMITSGASFLWSNEHVRLSLFLCYHHVSRECHMNWMERNRVPYFCELF